MLQHMIGKLNKNTNIYANTFLTRYNRNTHANFNSCFTRKKNKSTIRTSIYYSKDKLLSLPWRKWSNVANLPPDHQKNGNISGAQCWSLLLANLALISSCNSSTLVSGSLYYLFMCKSHLCHHGFFVHEPLTFLYLL